MLQGKQHEKHTGGSILYLLLSFPLGIFYFVTLVVGLSLGVSTLIIWIGIPILLLTIACVWGMASLEREMAVRLLHVDMPTYKVGGRTAHMNIYKGLWARIKDPLTWRSLLFLLLKFPLGIFAFSLTLVLLMLSLAFTLEPLWYVINTYINGILMFNHIESHSWLPFLGYVQGNFDIFLFARSFLGVPLGIALWIVSTKILNGLAWGCGEMARLLLSPEEVTHPKDEFAGFSNIYNGYRGNSMERTERGEGLQYRSNDAEYPEIREEIYRPHSAAQVYPEMQME
ncbi:sensor domain-containing protein [Ktedonosporobacter rubrisoli]|nr:sensor domain-containing protein [Ktedonosporobacter rubrisoli]